TSGYKFVNQPFLLVLSLEIVQPFVTADPQVVLNLSADQAELSGVFKYQVTRGGIDEVTLNWPNWKSQGWVLEPLEPAGKVEQTIVDDPAAPDAIRIRLLERTAGSLEL